MPRRVKDRLFSFQQPTQVDDGHGGEEDGFEEVFQAEAFVINLRGRETVIASRMQGVQPIVVHIDRWDQSELVTTGWRLVDQDTLEEFHITTAVPTEDRRDIEITAASGVPR